ncbi:MAG: hypothetical protein NWE76_04590 [Candidatus Bathyarchaeota archaeon]|nr:hypothetical protein [Candidatus Bathyarchaeota archaeon]
MQAWSDVRDAVQQRYEGVAAGAQKGWDWMGQSALGTSLQRGTAESFGWHFGKTSTGKVVNEGFLGWRTVSREAFADRLERRAYTGDLGKRVSSQRVEGVVRNLRNDPGGAARARWLLKGSPLKTLGRFAGRAIPLAFTGWLASSGYKEGGLMGAAGGIAESIATTSAIHMAGLTLSSPLTWIVAGGIAAGAGGYALGEAAQAHRRGLKTLEMGANVVDPFGTAATLRQRSLTALQNSKINGRMGLGNEALIMHRSF